MSTLPMLLGLAVTGLAAVCLAVRPAAVTLRERRRERRLRELRGEPEQGLRQDMDLLMERSLSAFELSLVHRWTAERAILPALQREWLVRHGAEALLLCLAAGFTNRELVDHLDDLGTIDRRSLELQAELRALEASDLGSPAWD